MDNPSFFVYRSSAGSGKTRTLAKEYIKLALSGQPGYFRHVLAVTFANKATQEMKERILTYLDQFAHESPGRLEEEIQRELSLTPEELKEKSQAVLSAILHKYSQFSISTIDAFFQRIIRAFTREAGLLGNFRLEIDNEYVLDEVIAALMDELGSNRQLTDWVIQFSNDRLVEGENWNVVYALRMFAQEIFKEPFKAIEESILRNERTADDNRKVIETLRAEMARFQNTLTAKAKTAMQILKENGITASDFNYTDKGTAFKYFSENAAGDYFSSDGSRIQGAMSDSNDWPSKKSPNFKRLKDLATEKLMPILQDMDRFDKQNYPLYKSAQEILKNYYAFGLIADITRKLKVYREENNVMLLSDAPNFLNGVINNSDTPFIYEKVGSWFNHYLIDEFQDTSGFQWKNFVPLLKEAGDQGYRNLIVGDVKQSVYRWRGGDLELLQNEVTREFGEEQVKMLVLDTNYRSAGKIVTFNNSIFKSASDAVANMVSHELPEKVFSDARQNTSRWPDKGFVRLNFLERGDNDEWQEEAISKLPLWLETLQDKGVRLKDIAILVRKNDEGQRIANYLLQFQNSDKAKANYKYDVVSNESLRLDTSYSVNVLISALRFLKNPEDKIALGQLAYEVSKTGQLDELFVKAATGGALSEILPEAFISRINYLKRFSLFEMVEEMIRIFELGVQEKELAYLQAFQDLVLEFSAREKTDIISFLEWWDLYKEKKSIKVSGNVDAVNILTIHMSKGLQFRYVIIPFLNWRLNHEVPPLLWVTSKIEPFKSLGSVAVRYSSSLDKTVFKDDYRYEFTKAHLDNLNLLYVAFTRAEAGLIGFAPFPTNSNRVTTVGDLLYQVLKENPDLSPSFRGPDFESGEVEAFMEDGTSSAYAAEKLTSYASSDWREKLVIKREGSEFFEVSPSEKRSKINRGILLHTLLSRIEYKTDAKEKLSAFFMEYALPPEEMDELTKDIHRILDHPRMSNWFSKEWAVRNEALVLMPGGTQKRIDRILLGKDRTIIIDYKTGERKAVDRTQVEMYASVLTQMGYPNVQACLVYLKDLHVEEVVSKSNLSLF